MSPRAECAGIYSRILHACACSLLSGSCGVVLGLSIVSLPVRLHGRRGARSVIFKNTRARSALHADRSAPRFTRAVCFRQRGTQPLLTPSPLSSFSHTHAHVCLLLWLTSLLLIPATRSPGCPCGCPHATAATQIVQSLLASCVSSTAGSMRLLCRSIFTPRGGRIAGVAMRTLRRAAAHAVESP